MARVRIPITKGFFKRAGWLMLVILFVVTGLGVGIVSFWQNTHQKDTTQTQPTSLKGTKLQGFTPVATVSELQTTDQSVGNGKAAADGSTVVVMYTGALAKDGTIFDTTADSGQPATFQLVTGPNGVIEGFAKGIVGMKVGGTRQILIPAAMGYGAQGSPPAIPPNSDLVFNVTLEAVQ